MGRKVEFTCDSCETEHEDDNNLWSVGIVIKNKYAESEFHGRTKIQALWCRECMERHHLLDYVELAQKKEPLPPPPTIEDMIRDIVHEAVEDAQQH